MLTTSQLCLDIPSKTTLSSTYDDLGDPIDALQCPLDALVARQPLLSFYRDFSLCTASFQQSLLQAKDVRSDLRSDTLLCTQTGDGDNTCENSSDLEVALGEVIDRVREEGSVM